MKMTRGRKCQAYALLMQGRTVHQIADALGTDVEGLARYMLRMDAVVSRECACPGIANWLKEHNMTGVELAEAAGISRQTISNVLVGRTSGNPTTRRAILRATGMSHEEAFGEEW